MTSPTCSSFSVGLWNCQSVVQKSDFCPTLAMAFSYLLALTETWIRPENTATPAALMNNYVFSHTSRLSGRGGRTGFLVFNDWKLTQLLPAHSYDLFEYHAIMITSSFKLYLVVMCHPPGQLGSFVCEMDILLSALPMDNCPLLIILLVPTSLIQSQMCSQPSYS